MRVQRLLADTKRLVNGLHAAGGVMMLIDVPAGIEPTDTHKAQAYLISTQEYEIYMRLKLAEEKRTQNHNLFPRFSGTPDEVKAKEEAMLLARETVKPIVSDEQVAALVADNGMSKRI